ncbi:tyrosine-protein phosphatase [Lapidilactobacillus wuchangensis]|uniref:tyrosine-protein phosphatase n=1 Tax=Lapidilactobacillus wuchangensis TaxID=2486001 RepID=UPI000F79A3A8|nr:tyrosine-protein phosphatase [Lapidilactobacillus wuchangensis]
MKELKLDNTHNVRDLGGEFTEPDGEVRYHKMIRSANLINIDQADNQLLYDYGVRTVIDLRSSDEVQRDPDNILIKDINYVNIPIFKHGDTDAAHHSKDKVRSGYDQMMDEYTELVTSDFSQKAYRKIFDIFLANDGADQSVLYHCLGGKDRTGIISLLFLGALGVPQDQIFADYFYTNFSSREVIEQSVKDAHARQASRKELLDLDAFMTAKKSYYDRMNDLVNEYGGPTSYLKDKVGLSDQDLQLLKKLYKK